MYLSRQFLLFILAGIAFLVFGGFVFLYQVRFFTSRAYVITEPFSKDNSYLFASPLIAKAKTQEKIRLTVFLLDTRGMGVANKPVLVKADPALQIGVIQGTTDNFGKAIFDISSINVGSYYPVVTVDGVELSQNVRLTFN